MKTTAVAVHFDVYQIITDRIIVELEHNKVPWRKPWSGNGPPSNLLTKRPYHGINVLLLNSLDYPSNYFLSFNQLKTIGGSVKKDEKGNLVVFWKRIIGEEPKDEDAEETSYKSVLRYYKVFNVSQCINIPENLVPTVPEQPYSPVAVCDEIIEKMPLCPPITYSKQSAYYNPVKDYINMPKPGTFESIGSYYSTLFHELIHSTGHRTRLNRKEITEPNTFGSDPYSIEELTAEIGATFLQSIAGLDDIVFDNSVSYINNWLKRLRSDKKLIVYASSHAQKAVDFILNVSPPGSLETQSVVEVDTV